MGAWAAADSTTAAAWFLEDDIEVSPLAFRWLEWCLAYAAAATAANPPGTPSALLGCSFYTPRVDELTVTEGTDAPVLWTPEAVLGEPPALPLFRMQVPCSWGSLWLRAPWARFQAYYQARAHGTMPGPVVLRLKSHGWWMSWKRYLVEHMILNGLYLVYPAFPAQASFTTNHYEVGVHHYHATDAHQPIPDALRGEPDARFCVPLITAEQELRTLPAVTELMARATTAGLPLEDQLPLVNWQHRLEPRPPR